MIPLGLGSHIVTSGLRGVGGLKKNQCNVLICLKLFVKIYVLILHMICLFDL